MKLGMNLRAMMPGLGCGASFEGDRRLDARPHESFVVGDRLVLSDPEIPVARSAAAVPRRRRSARAGAGRIAVASGARVAAWPGCPLKERRSPALRRAAALAVLLIGVACGADERSESAPLAAPADLEELERLAALGYVSGSASATSAGGVMLHEPERAAAGLNLVVSGHAPGASLVDMEGNLLHEWRVSFDQVWPGREVLPRFPRCELVSPGARLRERRPDRDLGSQRGHPEARP